jgi:hypothetical protein
MSADDEEHSESEFYYPTEHITLPGIGRNDVLFDSFIRVRVGRGDKEIKILFTGMVGPYRGPRPKDVFKTSKNISLYGPPIR